MGIQDYTYEDALRDLRATYGLSTNLYGTLAGTQYLLFTPPSTWDFAGVIAFVLAYRAGTPMTVTREAAAPPPPEPAPPAEPPPGGTIFDTIINWIKTAISSISNWVTTAVNAARDFLIKGINTVMAALSASIQGAFNALVAPLQSAIDWITATYNLVADWVSQGWTGISDAIGSAIAPVLGWVQSGTAAIAAWVSSEIGQLGATLSAAISSIPPLVASISGQLGSYFDWLRVWLPGAVLQPMQLWFDSFKAKVFDFPNWVGSLLDAVSAWLTVDVPGHSPRWTKWIDDLWLVVYDPERGFMSRLFRDPLGTVAQGMIGIVQPAASYMMQFFDGFITKMVDSVDDIGTITPGNVLDMNRKLITVGATVLTGLAAMTIAGDLLPLGSRIGLGHVSAMVYDLTNYKVLTGAFVGALAFAAIQTPLRYYYQDKFRPMLPREGEASAMFARDRLPSFEYRQLLGYYGLADRWHQNYEDLAYRPMSLVALSSLATAGAFDPVLTMEVLVDRGINPKYRPYMLDLYRRRGMETVKGMMSSVPIARFKQGFTNVDGFHDEMGLLSYTDAEIERYQAGAVLSYATDYITDLISAWQTQVRKKVMSLEAFRIHLEAVIAVPERIDAYIMREIVNTPVEEPKAVGLSIAVTRFANGETDTAQFRAELLLLGLPPVDLDRNVAAAELSYAHDYTLDLITAYRDAIRANNLSLGEYRQALLDIPLVPERVEGMVLIERARIKPKQKLTPTSPPTPFYATDIGKVQVDTIRRRRRKGAITRDEEIAALIGTGYDPDEAGVIADNDNERLGKGVTDANAPVEGP